jgi:arylsulfatase A-like enzyme
VSKVPRSDGPNVFLIVVDAASAKFFGVYGDAHATSPTIDAFARESVVFENAYSQSATTTASSVSLLTGVRGTTHLMTGQSVLPEQFKTAAERFRAHGYQTYGFIGNPFAGAPELGMDRGYDVFVPIYAIDTLQDKRATEGSTGFIVSLPGDLNDAVFARIDQFEPNGTFAYFHYLQPHKPYDAPARYAHAIRPTSARCTCSGAGCPCGTASWSSLGPRFDAGNETGEASQSTIDHLKARYRANIRYLDDGINQLFRSLQRDGLWEESLIVLMSDHGDAFFKHHRFGHNRTLYDDMVRIPMMIKFPRSLGVAPRRLPELVESVDVLPTIFDALGLVIPRCFEGESFWPLISGEPGAAPGDSVILATNRRDKHAIRAGSEKYVVWSDGTQELYDLAADPDEQHNIAMERPGRVAALRRQLEAVVDLNSTDALPPDSPLRMDPEMNRLLETLGYLEDDAPDLAQEGKAVSPRRCED